MFKIQKQLGVGKKRVSLFLALLLLFGVTGAVSAHGETPEPEGAVLTAPSPYYETSEEIAERAEPRYQRILKLEGTIAVDQSTNTGDFSGTVLAQTRKGTSTRLICTIQKYDGGWKDYKTYYKYGDATRCAWIGNSIPLDDGYSYRLRVTGTVYYNASYESDTLFTNSKRV